MAGDLPWERSANHKAREAQEHSTFEVQGQPFEAQGQQE